MQKLMARGWDILFTCQFLPLHEVKACIGRTSKRLGLEIMVRHYEFIIQWKGWPSHGYDDPPPQPLSPVADFIYEPHITQALHSLWGGLSESFWSSAYH
jgi:hypothetical protein